MTEQRDQTRPAKSYAQAAGKAASNIVACGAAAAMTVLVIGQETTWLDGTALEAFNRHAANNPSYDVQWPPLHIVPRPEITTPVTDAAPVETATPEHPESDPRPPAADAIEDATDDTNDDAADEAQELSAQQAIEELLLAEGKPVPPQAVHDAIAYAAAYTGVDAHYLYRLAHAESTFRTGVTNRAGGGRGACGLYQFRASSTYLEAIHRHGAKFPPEYQHLNGSVERYTRKGETRYRVRAGHDQATVFRACHDPKFASVLAAFFTLDLKAAIENRVALDRPLTHADLYIAHFLGINGGPRFLNAYADENKHARHVSAYVGASQRRANRGIFNRVTTVGDFYTFFVEDKGMTDAPLEIGTPQFNPYPQLPERGPIPHPRPRPDI